MANILEEIMTQKRSEVKRRQAERPLSSLNDSPYYDRDRHSLRSAIEGSDDFGIIAEFKRRSPSQKDINLGADPQQVAAGYQRAGVAGMSVLTDELFFGAKPNDFAQVRETVEIPLLRKDFVWHEYQIFEARSMGADAVLLIAACLEPNQLHELAIAAKENELDVLCELHTAEELKHINDAVDIVGVNNRALKNFTEDIGHSRRLIDQIPPQFLTISESSIDDPDQVLDLRRVGYKGYLIGTYFMRHPDPGSACSRFITTLHEKARDPKESQS
ncbi:MAG: indole-3-glycerol phosphate synthase TrpC [Bacteroidota bacterium]